MKVAEYYWDHPALRPLQKQVSQGQYLFRQGDRSNTMVIITQGVAELIAEREGKKHILGLIEAGDFLGERSVLSHTALKRVFSARAKTDLTVIELGLSDITSIRKNEPSLMADLLSRMFQMAADRLHKSNQLIHILRPSDNWKRLLHLIAYFSRTAGRKAPTGTEVLLTIESLQYYIDLTEAEIHFYLRTLERHGLLQKLAEQAYLVPDEKALLKAAPPDVMERLAG